MQGISEQQEPSTHLPERKPTLPSPKSSWVTRTVALVFTVLLIVGVIVWGISSRKQANAQLTVETAELAVPAVSVVHPKQGAPQQEFVLPGNMQPYIDAPIYARTSGYLKAWHVDIGTHVKTGQLLAEIDAPEVDQQLQQAQADLQTAEANSQLAQVTATRYTDLLKTDSVAKQDVDNANGALAARKADVESAQANVKRLQDLQSFEKIYAPFDGVITARNTDIGALIDSGSSAGSSRELFHIAAENKLRVYVNVPEVYTPEIKAGMKAELTLSEYPGRTFEGTLVRNADAIDSNTRTLLTEVDVDNPLGELKPGGYVEVHFKLPSSASTFVLPVSAFIFKAAGMQLATVKDGKAHLVSITPGRDFGNELEVVAGLKGDEAVINNPPDYLTEGQPVRPVNTVSDKGQS